MRGWGKIQVQGIDKGAADGKIEPMPPRIIRVTYEATVHQKASRFVVPIDVRRALRLMKDRAKIDLQVRDASTDELLIERRTYPMMSGPEIYGELVRRSVGPRRGIRVEAWRPAR